VKKLNKIGSVILTLSTCFNSISQNSYCFTNAGATGSVGPNQTQINLAYLTTNLNGNVTSTNGVQNWTVPCNGFYKITGMGAKGGGNGGLGAKIEGNFYLIANDVLHILVGQKGEDGYGGSINFNGGGGGGATMISINTNSILIVAGGGGGGLINSPGGNGQISNNGGSTYFSGGGTMGNGGYSGITNGDAAGGGGVYSNGANSLNMAQNPCNGGDALINGGVGGESGYNGIYYGGCGGFGGGGSGWHNSINRCGGGGGFSGGQGGTLNSSPIAYGGGGGSFNSGSNQINLSGFNSGNGNVIITPLFGVNIVQTNSIQCYGQNSAVLQAITNGGNAPYTYTWLPSGGNFAIAQNLSAGTYTCLVSDSNNSITQEIFNVTQPPLFTINAIASKTQICMGEEVTLSANGANSYTWSNNVYNGVSFVPATTQNYTVTGTNSVTGCLAATTISVLVNSLPLVNLTGSSYTTCLNGSPINLYPFPTGGEYNNPIITNNLFNPTNNGTFVVVYTYTDSLTYCMNLDSITIMVSNCTSLETKETSSNHYQLSPNPSNGNYILKYHSLKEIQIFDQLGKIILEEKSELDTIKINIEQYENGIYYLKINNSMIIKLIKT
jgi:hypothetical protein